MSFNTGFFINQSSFGDSAIYNMLFDGVNEYITVPHNNAFSFTHVTPYSITASVKLVDYNSSSFQSILSKRDPIATYRGYMIGFANGNLVVYMASGIGNIISIRSNGFTFTNNTSYRIGFTYNGNTFANGVTIYVDGNAVSSTISLPGPLLLTIAHTEVMRIGNDIIEGLYTNGEIGSIRIWNTELTPGEILLDYNGGVISNTPIKSDNLVYGFRGGQNALYGTQWVFPDESNNITNPSSYSVNMEFTDRILIP